MLPRITFRETRRKAARNTRCLAATRRPKRAEPTAHNTEDDTLCQRRGAIRNYSVDRIIFPKPGPPTLFWGNSLRIWGPGPGLNFKFHPLAQPHVYLHIFQYRPRAEMAHGCNECITAIHCKRDRRWNTVIGRYYRKNCPYVHPFFTKILTRPPATTDRNALPACRPFHPLQNRETVSYPDTTVYDRLRSAQTTPKTVNHRFLALYNPISQSFLFSRPTEPATFELP